MKNVTTMTETEIKKALDKSDIKTVKVEFFGAWGKDDEIVYHLDCYAEYMRLVNLIRVNEIKSFDVDLMLPVIVESGLNGVLFITWSK